MRRWFAPRVDASSRFAAPVDIYVRPHLCNGAEMRAPLFQLDSTVRRLGKDGREIAGRLARGCGWVLKFRIKENGGVWKCVKEVCDRDNWR